MLLQEFNWKKEISESVEPVLVDFWAVWCPPCRAMNPVIETLAKDFKVAKVNVDTNHELVERLGITAFPTFLIFKGGMEAARFVGMRPEAVLREEMKKLSQP